MQLDEELVCDVSELVWEAPEHEKRVLSGGPSLGKELGLFGGCR